jgi:hypothetical protein
MGEHFDAVGTRDPDPRDAGGFEVFTHAERVRPEAAVHVA